MDLFYSPRRGGFFAAEIHGEVPPDAVPVSAERHAELLAGQSEGLRIVAGAQGEPVLLDPPPPGPEPVPEVVQLWQFRREVRARGWWDRMADAIGALPQPARADAEEWIEYGTEARRSSPRLMALAQLMDLTAAGLDDAFRAAAARGL